MSEAGNKFGLSNNWKQFSILVLINAFVGGMVGLERTILPEIAEDEFGIAVRSAIFSLSSFLGLPRHFPTTLPDVLPKSMDEKIC